MEGVRGFESYNIFKRNIKDLRQLYDITYLLYSKEELRLKAELATIPNKKTTIFTSSAGVSHGLNSLYQRLQTSYPYKIRQLLLTSAVTSLEVYLTDAVYEIFRRDISAFKEDIPITFQKNYLLNVSSIYEIQRKLIFKDIRTLTSGGLQVIGKYFKKLFDIDFKNLGISFADIEEIHMRRHLFVHRDGFADYEYSQKFPGQGFVEGEKIKIENDYMISTYDKIAQFAAFINRRLLVKFPEDGRKPKHVLGNATSNPQAKNLMIELSITTETFDHITFFNELEVRGNKIIDYVTQITTVEKSCFAFLSGAANILYSFIKPLKETTGLTVNRIIDVKNSGG